MLKKSMYVSLLAILVFVTVSTASAEDVSKDNKQNFNTIEAFTIDTFSDIPNGEGIYQKTGYKNVNSITDVYVENNLPVGTKISVIEDYYDLEGSYINSLIKQEESINDFSTAIAKTKKKSKILNTSIIEITRFHKADEISKVAVRNKVESEVRTLPESAYKNEKGFSYQEWFDLKVRAEEAKKAYLESRTKTTSGSVSILTSDCPTVVSGVEMCGAFDNYYNHTTSTGTYLIQALCCAGEDSKYARWTGTTTGQPDAATRVSTFKSYINAYDGYVHDDMELSAWPEVVSWGSALASFTLLVVGWAVGPSGWVAIVLNYANALTTFVGLTSASYGTYARMQYSKNAATQQENARSVIYNFFGCSCGAISSYVNGF